MILLIPIVSLLVVIFILFKVFITLSKKKNPATFGFILGLFHFLLVLFNFFEINKDPFHNLSSMSWIIFIFIDFPVSLFGILTEYIFSSNNVILVSYIEPLIVYGLLGSIEYYLLGFLFIRYQNKKNKIDTI